MQQSMQGVVVADKDGVPCLCPEVANLLADVRGLLLDQFAYRQAAFYVSCFQVETCAPTYFSMWRPAARYRLFLRAANSCHCEVDG